MLTIRLVLENRYCHGIYNPHKNINSPKPSGLANGLTKYISWEYKIILPLRHNSSDIFRHLYISKNKPKHVETINIAVTARWTGKLIPNTLANG